MKDGIGAIGARRKDFLVWNRQRSRGVKEMEELEKKRGTNGLGVYLSKLKAS